MPNAPGMRSFAPPPLQLTADGPLNEDESESTIIDFQTPGAQIETTPAQQAPLQRQEKDPKPITYVYRTVTISEPMDAATFQATALESLFGGEITEVHWRNSKKVYAAGTHRIKVDLRLIQRHRAAPNAKRGFAVDEAGKIDGAEERATKELTGPPTQTQQELIAEINRRYAADTGQAPHIPGQDNPGGKAYWNQIRDEVLFQNDYLKALPEQVKRLIRTSTDGRKITAQEVGQLFQIARKIEGMDPAEVNDYFSKISGSTSSLEAFDQAVTQYIADRAARKEDQENREEIQKNLYGKEQAYPLYLQWKRMVGLERMAVEPALLQALQPEFSSIEAFDQHIQDFQAHFEREALAITFDLLDRYAGFLYQEEKRYQNSSEVEGLHQQLGGLRQQHQVFQENAEISNARTRWESTPGSMFTKGPAPVTAEAAKNAHAKAQAAKAASMEEVQNLSGAHPIFQEDHLPLDRRLDKSQLASSDAGQLGSLLQGHIGDRLRDVQEAKEQIQDDPELVYKLNQLLPNFYAGMGIAPESIFDQVVQDRISDIQGKELLVNILLAVVAVALAIVSFGAATPLIATGAAVAGFGLSSYMACEEYQQYSTQNDLADVGLSDDPSMFWLVVAAAALDMGAAVKAVRTLSPAAKALNAGGEFREFVQAVRSLSDAGEIEAKIAVAAEKAAAARQAGQEAGSALGQILKTKGAVKGFADPAVYRELVRFASAKVKEGVQSFHHFVLGIQKARRIAGIAGDLSPEEMAKAKEAWEQAVRLHKSAEAPLDIMSAKNPLEKIGEFSQGNYLKLQSEGANLHYGNHIGLDPHRTTTVAGVLQDTYAISARGEQMAGVTTMGANPGGINVLRSPHWPRLKAKYDHILQAGDEQLYWKLVRDEFWEVANKPWLEEAIKRGDHIRLVSDPDDITNMFIQKHGDFVIGIDGKRVESIFSKELDLLKSHGYTFTDDGMAMAPKL